MGFADLIGHERAIGLLSSHIQRDKVHHAYLLAGRPGIGKRTLALTYARALNCVEQSGDACDRCVSCLKFLAGTHPDLQVVGDDRSRAQLTIDDVRDKILRFVSFKVYEGRFRIILIIDAERMNVNTANALLKTLEEPPKQTVFLLTTSNLSSLLPTIRSRTQKLRLPPLSDLQVSTYLESRAGMDAGQAELLARLSDGSIGRALTFTSDQLSARDGFLKAVLDVGQDATNDPLALAEAFAGDRAQLTQQLELLESFLRDVALLQNAPSIPLHNPDKLEALEWCAARTPFAGIQHIRKLIHELRGALKLNISPQMALERLFFELAQVQRGSYGAAGSRRASAR